MMEQSKNPSSTPWGEISRLLIVLLSGIAIAGLLSIFMIWNYGPTGQYQLSNVLLAPETLQSLSFSDAEVSGSKDVKNRSPRFVFDKVEYVYWDSPSKQWQQFTIDNATYVKFYQTIEKDMSIVDINLDIVNLFAAEAPSHLAILVKNEGNSNVRPLQVLEIAPGGDYYRVELRGSHQGSDWAYFEHKNIAQLAEKQLIPFTVNR
jgi:hypothetical protein